jgi:hypothetical protein
LSSICVDFTLTFFSLTLFLDGATVEELGRLRRRMELGTCACADPGRVGGIGGIGGLWKGMGVRGVEAAAVKEATLGVRVIGVCDVEGGRRVVRRRVTILFCGVGELVDVTKREGAREGRFIPNGGVELWQDL